MEGLAGEVDHHIAAAQARLFVEHLFDNGPGSRMEGQGLELLVEGEGVQIPVEVVALGINGEAVGHLVRRGVDITLGRGLDIGQFLALEYALQVQVAGEVEEVTLFGGHHERFSAVVWVMGLSEVALKV